MRRVRPIVSGNRYALLVVDDMYDRIELKDADYEFLYNWVYEKKNALLFIGVFKVKELNKRKDVLDEYIVEALMEVILDK